MQFSTIIATLALALAATAAPAAIEARTGGPSGNDSGSCSTSSPYSHPVCCNGVTGPVGDFILINIISQVKCAVGVNVIGNVCGQESNNLCCTQSQDNTQNGVVNVNIPIELQCIFA